MTFFLDGFDNVIQVADEIAESCIKDYNAGGRPKTTISDDDWVNKYEQKVRWENSDFFFGYTSEEKIIEQQNAVRDKRDSLLKNYVDPYQNMVLYYEDLSDEDKEKLKEYRNALLAVPQQDVFNTEPNNVIWPEIPDFIK